MRVPGKGRVDRDRPVRFRFDGQWVRGFHGDTVASALMANDVRLIGRSFKYHRPRGVVTAGSEEPNGLVTIGNGPERRPNTRATTQEIWEGMDVRSQNAWPSLKFDALAINDLASPFLAAGFYYKTFMWPPKFWEKVYEPFIRRAAGLGSLSGETAPDTSEKAFAHCDLLVIGAGPTGLMAAWTAAEAGLDVILADENAELGGRLLSEHEDVGGQSSTDWVREITARLETMPNLRIMRRTTVTGAYDTGVYGALERVALHVPSGDAPPECFWRIHAPNTILATGALERGIAFPFNDRPGILNAGAARSYLHRWGVSPGKRIAIFCNNDDAHRTARDFRDAGLNVVALVDTRDIDTAAFEWPVFKASEVVSTRGRAGLSSIDIRQGTKTHRIATDCLAVSGGWNPALHLSCHMNGRPVWREDIATFVPRPDAVPGLIAAGAANGSFSTTDCLAEGVQSATRVAETLGKSVTPPQVPKAEGSEYRISPTWVVEAPGRAWLDFQNDVTTKDVKLAAQENYRSVEHMKRYTTQGMAPDQGKGSNVLALATLADATGRTIPETGTTTFRPPYVAVPIGALGAGGSGAGFAPERFTTSDTASRDRGAPMIEAGLWFRPSYFPLKGETDWRESCDREVRMVREAVGVADVSTLGKIDIQGPDAGQFLDFVYANMFSTLPVGRVRYGLMLREDGHVMDDGTCARLDEVRYLMTTTTAAAGQVMTHLAFVHQVLKPELDVRFTSVTEQWAQFAVAGPNAAELVRVVVDDAVNDEDWPFMAVGPVRISGVNGRLFRISFSGERGYEIAVPARYGRALFLNLLAAAEALGGGAYGVEALNVLRIEKGFPTHAELHGRTTAYDIGLERMLSKKKDFIGKAASRRPGLLDPARERLVGLRTIKAGDELTAGAHLFEESAAAVRMNDQGYLTSVCYSPTLDRGLGLGFLKNGPEREGEQLVMVDHLRKRRVPVEVTSPVAFDPDGERMRG